MSDLIFQWRDDERPLLRLFFWLVVTLVAGTGFFLLFQVVHPESRPFAITSQSHLLLDHADAGSRAILNRVRDEDTILLSTNTAAAITHAGSAPDTFPLFRPGFDGFRMTLKGPPATASQYQSPRLYSIDEMPLPPLVTVMKPSPVAATGKPSRPPQILRMVPGDPLAARTLRSSASLSGISLAAPARPRFRIAVNADGRVTFALPMFSSDEPEAMRSLQQAVSALVFEPMPAAPLQWGEITFRYDAPPPAP